MKDEKHEHCGMTPAVLEANRIERAREEARRQANPVIQLGPSPDMLTLAEIDELRGLAARQKAAYIAKDYGVSDELRAELMAWGAWPPEKGWHPVNETPEHRQARLQARRA